LAVGVVVPVVDDDELDDDVLSELPLDADSLAPLVSFFSDFSDFSEEPDAEELLARLSVR
jgi:hypothetical protein